MDSAIAVHWFRHDLRLADNPALSAAAARGRVVPVVIDDPALEAAHPQGSAFAWWRDRSRAALDRALAGIRNAASTISCPGISSRQAEPGVGCSRRLRFIRHRGEQRHPKAAWLCAMDRMDVRSL